MTDNNERIVDKEIALDMAYAMKPYIDISEAADKAGKSWLASSIVKLGELAAIQARMFAESDERWRHREASSRAMLDLAEQHEGRIMTGYEFKLSDPIEGPKIYQNVCRIATDDSELPIEVIEYYEGKFALVGDFYQAATMLGDSIEGRMLAENAEILDAELKEYYHGLDDNLPNMLISLDN